MLKKEWKEAGYVNESIIEGIDLKAEIRRLAKEKNAVIMAHYYVDGEVQDIADFIGDSLALAQQAAKTDADIIVLCGVHFMGETAAILCPGTGHTVVSYVNTTAATKAVTDVVVTSSNARQIVESLPKDEPIIFGPDQNLGNYINSITGRQMVLWNGACHVHARFSVEKILALKSEYPGAKILVHPECKGPVVKLADKVGSTAALLKFAIADDAQEFIVATESGILHEMQKSAPQKTFIPAPPDDSTCACNECEYMKLVTLQKLYNCLKYEWPVVTVDKEIAEKAIRPIERMLELSAK